MIGRPVLRGPTLRPTSARTSISRASTHEQRPKGQSTEYDNGARDYFATHCTHKAIAFGAAAPAKFALALEAHTLHFGIMASSSTDGSKHSVAVSVRIRPAGYCIPEGYIGAARQHLMAFRYPAHVLEGSEQATASEALLSGLVRKFVRGGVSCTLMAYGQTGSGKSACTKVLKKCTL